MEIVQQRIHLIEASLERLRARLPDLPINEVLILRLVLLLAHEFDLLLEHEIRPFGLGEGEFRVLTALFSQPEGIAHPSELCASHLAESGQYVAHQRCARAPRPDHARRLRRGPAPHGSTHHGDR